MGRVREGEEKNRHPHFADAELISFLWLFKSFHHQYMKQAEKRIIELDRLFTRLYEDNVSGKITDARFPVMSSGYEDEQKKLKASVTGLTAYIETAEQKSADVTAFISVVQKYERITELTPEIMHELIEKIVVHAPDKSSGHRTQQIDIYYRFDVAVSTAVADSMKHDKKRKVA